MVMFSMRNIFPGLPVALLLVVLGLPPRSSLAAPSGSDCLIASADVPEVHKGLLKGYLPDNAVPDSLQLLPPPPQLGQPEHALDDTVSLRSFTLPGTPRWNLAAADADLDFLRQPAPSPVPSEPPSAKRPHQRW